MCEDPTVDFVFVRDAWRASLCRVGNNSKCGGDKLRRSGVLRVDQECIESSGGAVDMAADMAKVVKPRERVDATASKAIASRRGVGRVGHLHYPSLVGTRGSVTP